METTQEKDLCLIELSRKAIGGRICKRKYKNMWRSAINIKDLHQTYTNQEKSLIPYPALGHLHSGAWISLALSPKQQVTSDICWLAQTISSNGLKPSPWQTSEMWTPRNLSGKTLSPGSGSLIPSSRTMDFNLITKASRDTAMIWELRIGFLPLLTPKEMVKLRLLTKL